MRAALVGTIVAACAAAVAATPGVADVKTGVDAWQQGDYAKAIAEWRPLAAAGDPDAQFNLGQAYKLGRGMPIDLPIAMDWFRKAAAQGNLRAADNLGLLLFQQGKREEAMPFIRKSAERGEPRAQYILGTGMFNGDIVAKDWVTAYALMTRAAAAGLKQATNSLEVMDKYIGPEDRRKGLELAANMANMPKSSDYAATSTVPQPATTTKPAATGTTPRRMASISGSASATPSHVSAPPPSARPVEEPPPSKAKAPPDDALRKRPASASPHGTVKPPPTSVAEAPPGRETSAAPPPAVKPAKASVSAAAVGKPPPTGGWRIQLGAFREAPRAKALWQNATSRVSGLSAYKLYLVSGGDVTRVQAGPLASEADATRLCGKVQAAGYSCLARPN
ncbi:MAG TPA: SPOR domain-containing protein [Sphingobium sp.]|uniref:SPOR domain-containing protein n=1 Tax=Sphingobium sp. TaxID=1912891 RepID=UPI002ED44076